MSWDVWLEKEIDGHDVNVKDLNNYTSNVWDIAYISLGFEFRDLNGMKAVEAYCCLSKAIHDIYWDREFYEEYNPSNGWGSVDGFLCFLSSFKNACHKFPSATVVVS